MSKRAHSMHVAIRDVFEKILPKSCSLIRDKACGGKQRIPLFVTVEKSRKTEFCNVDLLVLKANKIKIIVEIEESDVKPTQICGKFLTSALARCYIRESRKNEPVEMNDSVTFIQIVDTSKLVKEKTAKFKQWKGLELLEWQQSTIAPELCRQSRTTVQKDETTLDRLTPKEKGKLRLKVPLWQSKANFSSLFFGLFGFLLVVPPFH